MAIVSVCLGLGWRRLFYKERLNAFNFLAMTRITKSRIILDPALYKELCSPGRMRIHRDGWDILLIPSPVFGQVITMGNIPYLQLPQKYQKSGLAKKGDFSNRLRMLFNLATYEITDACMYYTDYREEQ